MQGKEILKLVDVLSNERGIPKDDVFEALEVALATAARRDFGKNKLSQKGKHAAKQLVTYLTRHNFSKITLIGHTDAVGSHQVNDKLSTKRALALKAYLRKSGISAKIDTIGKGKREPLQLDNQNNYTQAEINALNRRVEFKVE